jgi:hypothetical protein
MEKKDMLSNLTPVRVSVLKKMDIGETVIFRHTKYNQASSSIAKVPEFTFSQQTSLIVASITLESTKVVLVHRTG